MYVTTVVHYGGGGNLMTGVAGVEGIAGVKAGTV